MNLHVWRAASILALALAVGVGIGGCSNPAEQGGSPNVGLDPTKSETKGAQTATASPPNDTRPAPGNTDSPYVYRGGRDPVTGLATGAPQLAVERSTTPPVGPATAKNAAWSRTPPTDIDSQGRRTLRVQKGDTLFDISLRHHVSLEALMAANNLSSPKIMPGQTIVLPNS